MIASDWPCFGKGGVARKHGQSVAIEFYLEVGAFWRDCLTMPPFFVSLDRAISLDWLGGETYDSSMRLPDGKIRKLRISREDWGCAHELTFCCYRRLKLLDRDRTRKWFVEALDAARAKHRLELWAYVVMPEHVHVLFAPLDPSYRIRLILQSIKQPPMRKALNWLQSNSPEWLEKLRSAKGELHFWQPGGGYDRNVNEARTAWSIVNYIHENPVRRGLVNRSIDWPWSSARWYAGEGGVLLPMDGTPPKAD